MLPSSPLQGSQPIVDDGDSRSNSAGRAGGRPLNLVIIETFACLGVEAPRITYLPEPYQPSSIWTGMPSMISVWAAGATSIGTPSWVAMGVYRSVEISGVRREMSRA